MNREMADHSDRDHPVTIMSGTDQTLTQAQTSMLHSIEVWYRQYLTMIRSVVAKSSTDPIPRPSQFHDKGIKVWERALNRWIMRHIDPQLTNAIESPSNGSLMLRYYIKETNEAGSIGQVLSITTKLWKIFWSGNPVLVASDPFFQITDADREVAAVLVRIFDQDASLHTVIRVWTIFDLVPSILEYALVYVSISFDTPALFQIISTLIPGRVQLDLNLEWCFEQVMCCLTYDRPELAAWIWDHVAFTREQNERIEQFGSCDPDESGSEQIQRMHCVASLDDALRNASLDDLAA